MLIFLFMKIPFEFLPLRTMLQDWRVQRML